MTGDHADAPAITTDDSQAPRQYVWREVTVHVRVVDHLTQREAEQLVESALNNETDDRLDHVEIWPDSSIPEALATNGYPAWSDEDVAVHVLGSGATTYSWWKLVQRLPDGTYHARLENPDREEETVSTTFTADDVRRVRGEILTGDHNVNDTVRDALRDDPDADAVDCLLQVLVLGEVTYS